MGLIMIRSIIWIEDMPPAARAWENKRTHSPASRPGLQHFALTGFLEFFFFYIVSLPLHAFV